MLGSYYRIVGSAFDDSISLNGQLSFVSRWLFAFTGGAGNDTLDGSLNRGAEVRYFDSPTGVVVDLLAGTVQDGFGGTDSVRGIYGVHGSDHDDSIAGSATSDIESFFAGSGDDDYDGQGGADRVDYGNSGFFSAGVTVRLTAPGAGTVEKPAGRGTDRFTDIDTIEGSSADDVFIGTRAQKGPVTVFATGGGGSDRFEGLNSILNMVVLDGFQGTDVNLRAGIAVIDGLRQASLIKVVSILTGSGADTVLGSARSELIIGGSEFRPGSGDSLLGGYGDDTLLGLGGNDYLYGSLGHDSLLGGDGSDTLHGGFSDDTLDGGAGDDVLVGGRGADTFRFGPGFGNDTIIADRFDRLVVQSNAASMATETLASGATLWSFLGVRGTVIESLTFLHAPRFAAIELQLANGSGPQQPVPGRPGEGTGSVELGTGLIPIPGGELHTTGAASASGFVLVATDVALL